MPTMPAKSTWNTHQFTLHLISFIPFMNKKLVLPPPSPQNNVDDLEKYHKRSAKESAFINLNPFDSKPTLFRGGEGDDWF